MKVVCASCSQSFSCTSCLSCWCSSMPPILLIDNDNTGCFCPDCLKTKVTERISNLIQVNSVESNQYIKSLGTPNKLIEDIDYTINEKGLYVFTSWYLLRRGYCCENNCKNCPYP